MSKTAKIIKLGDHKYDGEFLRSVPIDKAIAVLGKYRDKDQIRNAWKQARGLSVRNHTKDTKPKATRKRTTKKPSAKTSSKK